MPRLDQLSRQTAQLVFLIPLISRILERNSTAIENANTRGERRGATEIETFLGIGCQIESGGTSTPYRSTRRRVCRMFNDGRERFRVSETGLPNLQACYSIQYYIHPFLFVSPSCALRREALIYINARDTRDGTSRRFARRWK